MNKFFKKHWVFFLLAVVLLGGFYLRIGGVLTNSFAFTYDVGRDMLEVSKIANDFDIPLIGQTSGLGGLYYGPWWYYILTPPFLISSGNPQGVAFFMVLTGMVTVILGYFFGSITSGRSGALISASFFAFSSAMIGLSGQIWNPNIAPPLLLLLFICMFKEVKDKRRKIVMQIAIGFLLGLLLDSEIVFGVLLIGGVFLSFLILEKKKFLSIGKAYILIGLLATLTPRILFEFRHNFIMTKSFLMPKNDDQEIFDIFSFFQVLPDRVVIFINQVGDTFGLSFIGTLILIAFLIFVWFHLRKHQSKLEKKVFITLLLIILVFLVGSSLFARAVWGHYLVGLPVIYILLTMLVLVLVIRKNIIIGVLCVCTLVVFSARPIGILSSIQNPYWEGNAAVYRNQVEVIDYVYKQAKGKNFNYIVYTPAVHDYPYQYLFSWYGEKEYGYVQSSKTESLFYVIIEPDPGYEGRVQDWLKIREGDGKVVLEEAVKGGIVVQTRTR